MKEIGQVMESNNMEVQIILPHSSKVTNDLVQELDLVEQFLRFNGFTVAMGDDDSFSQVKYIVDGISYNDHRTLFHEIITSYLSQVG
mgnify:CR=1 FL=1